MKEIKYTILYLVPVPLVKKLRFRFHNAADYMGKLNDLKLKLD